MLSQDKKLRGELTIHVLPHQKLGRHRTLLSLARRLVESVMAMKEVKRVHLGHILRIAPQERAELSHKVWIKWKPKEGYLHLCVSDTDVAQIFPIYLKDATAEHIAEVCQRLTQVARHQHLEVVH